MPHKFIQSRDKWITCHWQTQHMLMGYSLIINAYCNQMHTKPSSPGGDMCTINPGYGTEKCRESLCLNCWQIPLDFIENYFLELISGFMFDALSIVLQLFGKRSGTVHQAQCCWFVSFSLRKTSQKKTEKPLSGKVFRNYSHHLESPEGS